MTVYFIGGDFDRVKIGYTANPSAAGRLRDLQVGSPVPLRILASAPGESSTETWLHSQFQDNHVHGEWFRLDERLGALIAYVREYNTLDGWLDAFARPELFSFWVAQHKSPTGFEGLVEMDPDKLRWTLAKPENVAADPVSLEDLRNAWRWTGLAMGTDAEFIEHVVVEPSNIHLTNEVSWLARSGRWCDINTRTGLQMTAWHLLDASGDTTKEMAAWVQAACRDTGKRDYGGEDTLRSLRRVVPQLDSILDACRAVYPVHYGEMITRTLPNFFSLPEHALLSAEEFLYQVALHRAATWNEWRLRVRWLEGYHWSLEDRERAA